MSNESSPLFNLFLTTHAYNLLYFLSGDGKYASGNQKTTTGIKVVKI
jgi:hypothetical protein